MNNIKNKKQIYVWGENLEFFNGLHNKSKLVNLLIRKYRLENEVDKDGEPEPVN